MTARIPDSTLQIIAGACFSMGDSRRKPGPTIAAQLALELIAARARITQLETVLDGVRVAENAFLSAEERKALLER